jgi:hypothetical protein
MITGNSPPFIAYGVRRVAFYHASLYLSEPVITENAFLSEEKCAMSVVKMKVKFSVACKCWETRLYTSHLPPRLSRGEIMTTARWTVHLLGFCNLAFSTVVSWNVHTAISIYLLQFVFSEIASLERQSYNILKSAIKSNVGFLSFRQTLPLPSSGRIMKLVHHYICQVLIISKFWNGIISSGCRYLQSILHAVIHYISSTLPTYHHVSSPFTFLEFHTEQLSNSRTPSFRAYLKWEPFEF